ncbi:MAG: putative DNA binding domain-containing protein [Candidatus Poribacteria bacterium]|nr:putative DNA binding domain-containing protein [Candidatus Poribacteria bacterium]
MDNLIRKKIVLSLLDNDPKDANEIVDEIGESLGDIEDQLTALVLENICEKINQNEVDQYVIRKDIETFEELVKEFLSNKEEHIEQITQFITSEYYFNRIDNELVDYVLKRFYLDSLYQTDTDIEGTRRILHASPSALFFSLFEDTTRFKESSEHLNQLKSPDENWDTERIIKLHCSMFEIPLSEKLYHDIHFPVYNDLYKKLGIRATLHRTQVILATLHEKYIETDTIGNMSSYRAEEVSGAGQLIAQIDPIVFCDDGIAYFHLGEFQFALELFDKAIETIQDPILKAKVLNNKGWVFLEKKQYQKAIECFEMGISYDSEGKISELRANKQVAEEYLARATDADNLTEPTQIRFIHEQVVPFDETRFYEFKEIKGNNPSNPISKDADVYTVAFLNREGGRIFWGIRDGDRITVGVKLNDGQRDRVRRIVSEKLGAIQPPLSVEDWQLEFHQVYDLQSEIIENLWVIELLVSLPQRKDVYYTGSNTLYVKTEGGKKKLSGVEVTEFIRRHFQNDTETE